MHILNHIVLVGVGLIGGSFVLDLKKQGLVRTVTGIDTDRDNLQRALERGVIDRASAVIDKNSIADADLIVIATPVASVSGILTALAPVLPTAFTAVLPPTRLPAPTEAGQIRRSTACSKIENSSSHHTAAKIQTAFH